MSSEPGTTPTIRPSAALWGLVALAAIVTLALALVSFRVATPYWTRVAFVGLVAFAILALADLAVMRIELRPDGLGFVRNFQRHFVPREVIAMVTWEKGAGVAIRLTDGGWVKLPVLGLNDRALLSTLRTWLTQSAPRGR